MGEGKAVMGLPGGSVQLNSRTEGTAHHGWLVLGEENLQLIAARPSWALLQASSCDGPRKPSPISPALGVFMDMGLHNLLPSVVFFGLIFVSIGK